MPKESTAYGALEERIDSSIKDLQNHMNLELKNSADRCYHWALHSLRERPLAKIEHKIRTRMEEVIENSILKKVDEVLNNFESNFIN